MKLFQGQHYHEAIPEIKCLADFDGAQIFRVPGCDGSLMLVLAYTEDQARTHAMEFGEEMESES